MQSSGEEGFTLIESMISMFVASVVLLAMAMMLINTIKTNKVSEVRRDAVSVASSIAKSIGSRSINTPGYTQALANNDAASLIPAGSGFTATVSMNPTVAVQGHENINVQVAWVEHNNSHAVNIQTQVVID